jgi:hypothetical protein
MLWRSLCVRIRSGDEDENREPLRVMRLSDQIVSTPGHERYLLLTSLGWPRGQDYRPAQRALGGAVFERTRRGWRLQWSRRIIDNLGDDQGPPKIVERVRVGKSKAGFVIHYSFSSNGYAHGGLAVIAEMNGGLKEVLNLGRAAGHDGCFPKPPPDCYRYDSKLTFVPGRNPAYFAIVRVTSGTYSLYHRQPIYRIKSTARYVFRHGRYQPVQ